jgi:hypothetical protein
MTSRLKKLNRRDLDDRDCAVTYIDGEIIEDETHAGCINYYLQMHKNTNGLNDTVARPPKYDNYYDYTSNGKDKEDEDIIEQNIKQLAFAHKCDEDNSIYIEEFSLQNIDINTAANAFKEKYPDYTIYIDETDKKIARLKKKKMQRTANYVTNDFDSFFLGSGDVIAIGCRLVNNKPRYQVYQEGLYCSSSYYDGDDYDRALQMYKDLMTAFNGVGKTEGFAESEAKIKENIKSLINEKEDDDYNFDKLKSDPLFLGVNRNDW